MSCIPVLDNGTKKPAIRWSPYQARVPELGEVDQWWGNGRQYGLALICGGISGNLEMTEIEGRAASGDSIIEIENAMDEVGATAIWDRLTTYGYMEMSPSGGLHFLYRITDHPVPGNTKIATGSDQLVLAETRGEGGYVIVAPTTGLCHPSGEGWTLVKGIIGELPLVTWEERCLLHAGLHKALGSEADVEPVSHVLDIRETPALPAPAPPSQVGGAGVSPNDDFEDRTDWAEILEPHGWSLESKRGQERFWTRPGKDRRLGASATTGLKGDRDRLYVFSTSTVFPTEEPITKYMAWAILNFGGDKRAATQELVRRGFGSPVIHGVLDSELDVPEVTQQAPAISYVHNDSGNASHLRDRVAGRYVWVANENRYYHWDGRVWAPDVKNRLAQEFKAMTNEMRAKALADNDAKAYKYWVSAGNAGKVDAALKMMRSEDGITVESHEMNRGTRLLNVSNGILDLANRELLPHDLEMRQTRLFAGHYDPEAYCPRFTEFIESAVPDPAMRSYVQRALGYSLLGDVDQRAMFLIYGPSGTGKSTLMETMRSIFGDYGTTAASGAFRAKGREGGVTNDLHGLRGKRFVTTSETAEGTSFDEDLLKRLTGRDSVQSRDLYEHNQEWVPECAIWLATNHPPRFNSDDDAIWRRAKLIPFTTQFLGSAEVPDMSRRFLVPEASGILNWLLDGLFAYLCEGLAEPELVSNSARDLRSSSDSVIRFVDDSVAEASVALDPSLSTPARQLYLMYQSWCLRSGERALRMTRFVHRLESGDRGILHVLGNGSAYFSGIGRSTSTGQGHLFGG